MAQSKQEAGDLERINYRTQCGDCGNRMGGGIAYVYDREKIVENRANYCSQCGGDNLLIFETEEVPGEFKTRDKGLLNS